MDEPIDDVAAIEARLCSIFEEQMHLAVPSAETDLFEVGGMDSLSFVELLLYLDREFGVYVTLDALDLSRFRTIAAIARFIADYRRTLRSPALRPMRHA